MKPNVFTKARNVTGVYLNFPLETQFQWLNDLLPGYKQVAVLYNPQENEENIKKAKKIAKQHGLNLIAFPVETAKQLPYALEQLANNVQVLLAMPDKVAMSPKTAQAVLLASFRNRVPFIGLSNKWVKAGSRYALTWDYADLGRQCATQAIELLKGTSILKISPEPPRKVFYLINLTISNRMKLEIPETTVARAKIVFK